MNFAGVGEKVGLTIYTILKEKLITEDHRPDVMNTIKTEQGGTKILAGTNLSQNLDAYIPPGKKLRC